MANEKTKMMVSVWTLLVQRLNEEMALLGFRRDNYLNRVIGDESQNLLDELPQPNSDKAKAFLVDQLKLLPRTPVSIVLDKAVYEKMEGALAEKNVARDCFVNRLFFFLVADSILERLGIHITGGWRQDISINPLKAARGFLHVPFFDIRVALEKEYADQTFYSLEIPRAPIIKDVPSLYGLNCYIEDNAIGEPFLDIGLVDL